MVTVPVFPLTAVLANNKVFNVHPVTPDICQKEMHSGYLLFICLYPFGLIWINPGTEKTEKSKHKNMFSRLV